MRRAVYSSNYSHPVTLRQRSRYGWLHERRGRLGETPSRADLRNGSLPQPIRAPLLRGHPAARSYPTETCRPGHGSPMDGRMAQHRPGRDATADCQRKILPRSWTAPGILLSVGVFPRGIAAAFTDGVPRAHTGRMEPSPARQPMRAEALTRRSGPPRRDQPDHRLGTVNPPAAQGGAMAAYWPPDVRMATMQRYSGAQSGRLSS